MWRFERAHPRVIFTKRYPSYGVDYMHVHVCIELMYRHTHVCVTINRTLDVGCSVVCAPSGFVVENPIQGAPSPDNLVLF